MSAAVVSSSGVVRKLDKPAQSVEVFTSSDAADLEKLARIVQDLRKRVTSLESAHRPRWVEFEDVTVSTGAAAVRLVHGFGKRVRWEVVGWQTSGANLWNLKEDTGTTGTDANALVLLSYVAGTATIRITETG